MPKIRPHCKIEGCLRMGKNKGHGSFKNVCNHHYKMFKKQRKAAKKNASKQQSIGDGAKHMADKMLGYRGMTARQMLKDS